MTKHEIDEARRKVEEGAGQLTAGAYQAIGLDEAESRAVKNARAEIKRGMDRLVALALRTPDETADDTEAEDAS